MIAQQRCVYPKVDVRRNMLRDMIGNDQDIEIAAIDLGKGLAPAAMILDSANHHPFRSARTAAAASAICRPLTNRAKHDVGTAMCRHRGSQRVEIKGAVDGLKHPTLTNESMQ